jgi:two-component system chemotaxis response regulator CheY
MTSEMDPAEKKPVNRKEATILLVDDSATFRTITRRMLHTLGFFKIVDCPTAEDALTQLQSTPVDVVICDWTLPGMSGLDLFQNLRGDDRFKELPFLIVTANTDRRTVLVAAKAGIPSYIVKPLKADLLAKKIEQMLAKASNAHGTT